MSATHPAARTSATAPALGLIGKARRMAEELCENAPLSVQAILRSLRENQFHLAEADALKREEELGWPIFATQDAREGMKAFKEKRKPNYIGK